MHAYRMFFPCSREMEGEFPSQVSGRGFVLLGKAERTFGTAMGGAPYFSLPG